MPVKDQATLLRAVDVARRSGARFDLDILGAGPLENRLKALAARLGIDDITHFRGAVPHHDLRSSYRSAHAFVLSSRHEAQCLAALEAAACGITTVGTCVGVLPELAPRAALTVPVSDSCALGTAIVDLLRDPNRRDEMGRAARARVESDYSLETSLAGFRRLYEELAR